MASEPGSNDPLSSPQIAWTGSKVMITAADAAGNAYSWWQAVGSATSNLQTVASGGYSSPSIAWTGSSVIIAAEQDYGQQQGPRAPTTRA